MKKAGEQSVDVSALVGAYCSFFLNSEEAVRLKEKQELLHKDEKLLALAARKKELEDELSLAVLRKQGNARELMDRYTALLGQINALPSVREYDEAFQAVKSVKALLEKGILRKL